MDGNIDRATGEHLGQFAAGDALRRLVTGLRSSLRHVWVPGVARNGARLPFVTRMRVVLEVLLTYPGLIRLVRTNDLEAMVAHARRASKPPVRLTAAEARESSERLAYIVGRVLALMPTDRRCLIHSLVLVRLLSRRGIEARLVIGASTDQGFAAHAWVECEGEQVLPAGGHDKLVEF